jgi:CubicO group peptidase (beta-lactamase class C family)
MKLPSLLVIVAILSGCASAPTRPSHLDRGDEAAAKAYLTKVIDYEMRKSSTPGLSIALVDDQRIVWAQGFGYADLERQVPAGAETIYRVGSISKLFTDTAALQLAEQGRLDIDRPLKIYLPDFAIKERNAQAAPITPRHLMTHHSGLPRDVLKGFETAEPAPFASVVSDIRAEYAAHAPGEIFSYSNLGITLLGSAIQQVSGVPFAAHLKQSVLLPLGMSSSSFETGVTPSPLMAKGYQRRELKLEPPMRDVPAGGLNSSVVDLSRFMSMMFAGGMSGEHRILKPATIDEMLRPQNGDVALDLNFQVGLGWMLSTLGRSTIQGGGVVAHHGGAIEMYRSQLYILPQHKLGVVVLANSGSATQVVDRIATETLAAALEVKTGIRQPPFAAVVRSEQPASEAAAAALVGDYTTIAGPARVFAEGRTLRGELAGRKFDLVPRSDGLFAIDYAMLGFLHLDLGTLSDVGLSLRKVGGHDALVARIGSQEMLVGDRVSPPQSLGAWRNRLGDYEIANLGGDGKVVDRIRLIEERGYLIVEMTETDSPGRTQRVLLMPRSDTEATSLSVLNDAGETIRIVTVDGEERLVASGYQARRVVR